MDSHLRGSVALLLAAFIWGTALAAQRVGMEHIGPFAFNAARFLIGAAVLLPIMVARKRCKENPPADGVSGVPLAAAGGLCGLILFVTASLQQIGILYTSAGKAGFLTALYIVIVPGFELFRVRRLPWQTGCGVLVAAAGMYFLCIQETLALGKGDALVLLCAVSTAAHIVLIGRIAPRVDGVKVSCIQFAVCGGLSLLVSVLLERPGWNGLLMAWVPIVYTGVLSCAVAYTLQTLGQRSVPPVVASLILSLESVFSVMAGWLLLGERFSAREGGGCVLILAAIICVQMQDIWKKRESLSRGVAGAER